MSCRIVVDKNFVPRPTQSEIDSSLSPITVLNTLTMRTQCNGQDLGQDTFFFEYYQPDGQPADLLLTESSGTFPFIFDLSPIFWQRNIGWMLIRSAGAPGEVVRVDFQQPGQSLPPPSYSLEVSPYPLKEGRIGSVRVKGANIPEGQRVRLELMYDSLDSTASPADFTGIIKGISSDFNVYNEAFFTVDVKLDNLVEDIETVVLALYDEKNGQLLATALAPIEEIPQPGVILPNYQIMVDRDTIEIGQEFLVRIATQNRTVGSKMFYEIRPSADDNSKLQQGDIDQPIRFFVEFETSSPGGNYSFTVRGLDHRNYVEKSFEIRVYDGNGMPGSLVLTSEALKIQSIPIPECGPYEDQEVVGSITGGTVWGSNPYTDNSDFNRAAVHAGLIEPGQSAKIRKMSAGFVPIFSGSIANNIITENWITGFCGASISLLELITFDLSGPNQIAEGGASAILTLNTVGIPDGTQIPYNIAGILPRDIDIPLTGTLEIQNGMANIEFRALDDGLSDGNATMRFSVSYNGRQQARKDILILDIPSYSLTAPVIVNEGTTFTIRLDTERVADGTSVPFTINGTDGNDILWRTPGGVFAFAATGDFLVNSDSAEIEVQVIADRSTEGSETFTVELDNGEDSVTIEIMDTSLDPTYNLTAPPSADEGTTFTIRLDTTGIDNGTSVPFTISGVDGDDVQWRTPGGVFGFSSTGNFAIMSDSAEIEVQVISDNLTEGPETFTLTLDGLGEAVDVLLNDTSLDPTYNLTSPPSADEGTIFTIRLDTTGVMDGTGVPFTVSGVGGDDVQWRTPGGVFGFSSTGNFVIDSNTAEIEVQVIADRLTEGAETFTLSLDNGTDTIDVLLNDTSLDPTYSLTAPTSADEGTTFVVRLDTERVLDGTSVPFTISGVSGDDVQWRIPGGVFGFSANGNFVVNSDVAEIEVQMIADNLTEGPETFTLTLSGRTESVDVLINDTSLDPTYSLTAPTSADEGTIFTIRLDTTGVMDGDLVPFTITGVAGSDVQWRSPGNNFAFNAAGNFEISSNAAEIEVQVIADNLTEGPETFTLTLDGLGESIDVLLNDTSLDPTYNLTAPLSADEGTIFTIRLDTERVADGTSVPFTISGVTGTDILWRTPGGVFAFASMGDFIVNSDSAEIEVQVIADRLTEGSETLTLSLDARMETVDVTLNDTSLDPTYTLTAPVSADEGTTFTIRLDTERVDNGELVPFTISGVNGNDIQWRTPGGVFGFSSSGNFAINNNFSEIEVQVIDDRLTEGPETLILSLNNGEDSVGVLIADTSLDPTYSLTAPASANEGSIFTVRLDTERVLDGTSVPFAISGVNGTDVQWRTPGGVFGFSSNGNFIVNSDLAEIEVQVIADRLTEGSETFTLTLTGRTEEINVTINDTSLDPTYSLSGPATATEGDEIIIQLDTTEVTDGTLVPFTFTGVSTADVQWRSTPGSGPYQSSISGDFIMSGNTSQIQLRFLVDQVNNLNKVLTCSLDNGGSSHTVAVTDATPILSASPSSSVQEGETLTITLSNLNVANGAIFPYVISGISSADLVGNPPLMGNFTVNNNMATESFEISTDLILGETENFILTLSDYPLISINIPIVDRSPTFALAGNPQTTVNEGNSWTVTLTTTNLADGETVAYTLTGVDAGDIGVPVNGNFVISSNSAQVVIPILSDLIPLELETLTLSLDNGQASVSVSVVDTTPYIDPYFDNVVLQLRLDEPVGSTTFVDSSNYGNTVTLNGSVTGSDTTSPLAGNSAYFNSGYLEVLIGPGDPLQLGLQDYTIDFWYYRTDNRVESMYSFVNGPSQLFWRNPVLYYQSTPGNTRNFGDSGIMPGTWNHFALERINNSTQMYVNGLPFLQGFVLVNNYNNMTSIRIGDSPAYDSIIGYMADFRVTVGVARYNGAYSVPTQRI